MNDEKAIRTVGIDYFIDNIEEIIIEEWLVINYNDKFVFLCKEGEHPLLGVTCVRIDDIFGTITNRREEQIK